MTVHSDMAIIGISPRNSYYADKANIEFAIDEAIRRFGESRVFIPGALDRHNYLAYGYAPDRALNKANEVSRALKSSVREICARKNISCAHHACGEAKIRIIDWASEVEQNPLYQASLRNIQALYEANADFRKIVRETTQASIQSRMAYNAEAKKKIGTGGVEAAIDRGVHYLLGELAFLDVAPQLYKHEKLTYFYHREWPVFQKYIAGAYGCKKPRLAFGILNPQPA